MSIENRLTTKVVLILLFLFAGTCFASLLFGGSRLSPASVFTALVSTGSDPISSAIIWQLRVPRLVLGILVGAGLAATGCMLQGLLRNPLAEPYTIGISGGAALGATLAIILKLSGKFGQIALPLAAFTGAFLSLSISYAVAARRHFSVSVLILGGVVLNFLFSALVLLILAMASSEEVHGTILWLMGDLSSTDPGMIRIAALPITAGLIMASFLGRKLDILTLGEEKAAYLGLDTRSLRRVLFVVASLLTGTCVAISGIVGFVGLIIPHLFRRVLGPRHAVLIPVSAMGGAVFLPLCDTIARTIVAPLELPVGVVTGIIGGVFFLFFIFRKTAWEAF
ncbi:MAG: iron ABC transporter permease [Pseudomonadota bacterium]